MWNITVLFCIFNLCHAAEPPVDVDAEGSQELCKKFEEQRHLASMFSTRAVFHDHHSNTQKGRFALHLSESAEHQLCTNALHAIKSYFTDEVCICTTLESSAAFFAPLQEQGMQAHVGLKAGCVESKDPCFQNDFSKILEKNKDKNVFAFADVADQSSLAFGEFLVQLKSHSLIDESTEIILCLGVDANGGDHCVGNLYYGHGIGRTPDAPTLTSRAALRATQAERLSSGGVCDDKFIISEEFRKRYLEWSFLLEKRVKTIFCGTVCYKGVVFSTQDPPNLFVSNQPDYTAQDIMKHIAPSSHEGTLSADVLIGAPTDFRTEESVPSCIFGCGLRVFRNLRAEDANVRYVYEPNFFDNPIAQDGTAIPDAKDRVLLCAGPIRSKDSVLSWAKTFCSRAHVEFSDIFFVPCNSWCVHDATYTHSFNGFYQKCPREPTITKSSVVTDS